MNEYKIRQLNRMLKQINHYKKGELNIFELSGDLLFLRNHARDVDDYWEDFDDIMGFLEDTLAIANVERRGKLTSDDKAQIEAAIPKLIDLVQAELDAERE